MTPITLTAEIERALSLMGSTNVFLTGKAGTGKTTVSKHFESTFGGNLAVVAPTGIAALNAGGATIHSFFGIRPGDHLDEHWQPRLKRERIDVIHALDAVLIDEVSMVRADLLAFVDRTLRLFKNRHRPFGGVAVVLVGDPYQLPPVVTKDERELLEEYASPFFFDSPPYADGGFETIELTHSFRQEQDKAFLRLLDGVREGTITDHDLQDLNARAWPAHPTAIELTDEAVGGAVILCPFKRQTDEINAIGMSRLTTPEVVYPSFITGDFAEKDFPVAANLVLKEGARVMLMANNHDAGYVNGQSGRVVSLDAETVRVALDNTDKTVQVTRNEWERKAYTVTNANGKRKVSSKVIGTFAQLPIKPSWACTIHKAQGLTLNSGIVDLRAGMFEDGQLYVALSRMRAIDGLRLTSPVTQAHIRVNPDVWQFMRGQTMPEPTPNTPDHMASGPDPWDEEPDTGQPGYVLTPWKPAPAKPFMDNPRLTTKAHPVVTLNSHQPVRTARRDRTYEELLRLDPEVYRRVFRRASPPPVTLAELQGTRS